MGAACRVNEVSPESRWWEGDLSCETQAAAVGSAGRFEKVSWYQGRAQRVHPEQGLPSSGEPTNLQSIVLVLTVNEATELRERGQGRARERELTEREQDANKRTNGRNAGSERKEKEQEEGKARQVTPGY